MNPSANGWILKLLKEVSKNETFLGLPIATFYSNLKLSGYIYGNNISVVDDCFVNADFTEEELCKVNHVLALYYIHHINKTPVDFVESVNSFYNAIEVYKDSFFKGLLGKKKSSLLLESIIHKRIHIDDNVLTKNFKYFITNALLFIDVLAYQKHIQSQQVTEDYLKTLESALEVTALKVFELKSEKSKYDISLIKLFESSLRYSATPKKTYADIIKTIKSPLEKNYCVDIACMASWTDKIIEPKELVFLNKLGSDLHVEEEQISASIVDIYNFYFINQSRVALLHSKNMVRSFYDNSTKMVMKLISRNSKRLLMELRESKELMVLLTKSTKRNLTAAEQKKVHDQLFDIMKSIPSLAIFILPGGAILLPLFVKLIPKLLPSAFDDNRIED